ncbi:MAG: hypothetical protein IT370_27980 [Deltaproteobacteria bacterium]|nr:hypothetical protein [Deltaproteobacteria bacterium]
MTDFAKQRAMEQLAGSLMIPARPDEDYLAEIGRLESRSYIVTPEDLEAELISRLHAPTAQLGLSLPWPEMADMVRFEPGRWTLWSGRTHSGKTLLLRMLALHAIRQQTGFLFASLEEEPVEFLREALYQAACQRSVSDAFVAAAVKLWSPHLKIFNHTGNIKPETVLGVACHCAKEFGTQHVVIDSLMKLSLRFDDYDGQRELGNLISRVAKQYHLHIHLVAHPRKMEDDFRPMSMNDVRGAGDVINQADKVITIERAPEDAAAAAKMGLPDGATNIFRVHKQRGDINWTGRAPMYYDAKSRQLMATYSAQPLRLVPPELYAKQSYASQPAAARRDWYDDDRDDHHEDLL